MINLEFSTETEIKDALDIVRKAVDHALLHDEKKVEFEFQGKQHSVNLKGDAFNIGMLYGLSMAKDSQTIF